MWLLALALLAVLVSFTWERATSYDDGGLGSLAFGLLLTLGQPFLLPSYVLNSFSAGVVHWWNYLAWPLGLAFGVAFYIGLDRWTMAWLRRQDRGVDHSGAGAGA